LGSNVILDLKIGVFSPSHHALGKIPEVIIMLNTLIKPLLRTSILDLIISLLIFSEYAALFSFIFLAALDIS
jgi:hypothetical protein